MKATELYDLAHDGKVNGVASWLETHPDDLNAYLDDGMSLLHVACMFGHLPLSQFLIDRGALVNSNATNRSRATPLHLAVSFRDEQIATEVAKLLILHGAELNASQQGGQTPLHHAAGRGSVSLVDLLIEAGADPFLKDDLGRSASDVARDLSLELNGDEIRAAMKRVFSLSTQH